MTVTAPSSPTDAAKLLHLLRMSAAELRRAPNQVARRAALRRADILLDRWLNLPR